MLCHKYLDLNNNHRANVHYDLLRTGSTEQTATKILERGFLDAVRGRQYTALPI